MGKYPAAKRIFLPVICNHCQDPPCRDVCPTGATEKNEENGIVTVDYDKCIGCRACVAACPYEARWYLKEIRPYFPISEKNPAPGFTPFEEWGYKKFQEGVVTKCTLCEERIQEDPPREPACVETCPTTARYFGDLDDPTSEVSRLIIQRRGFQLRPEEGTDPSVYYID
ncbi:MAG: 4Fe-4S dicluster domain-containing protein [Thermodesulfobacteriota bacterium]